MSFQILHFVTLYDYTATKSLLIYQTSILEIPFKCFECFQIGDPKQSAKRKCYKRAHIGTNHFTSSHSIPITIKTIRKKCVNWIRLLTVLKAIIDILKAVISFNQMSFNFSIMRQMDNNEKQLTLIHFADEILFLKLCLTKPIHLGCLSLR